MPKNTKQNKKFERLILVTNREPFHSIVRKGKPIIEKTTGGLISALEPAIEKSGEALWVSSMPEKTVDPKEIDKQTSYTWHPVQYNKQLYEGFYFGLSNRVLWPLFHSMLDHRMRYIPQEWKDYKEVNKIFAQTILQIKPKNDFIWIHDYHLALVPGLVRKKITNQTKIGFFLHIPFPCFEIFRTLPWAKEILKGLLGSDIIGLHIDDYCEHFFDCVEELLKAKCDRKKGTVEYDGRVVSVKANPISIDTKEIYQSVRSQKIRDKTKKFRKEMDVKHLITGVDRLDYTKGIRKRLHALEAFFTKYPEQLGKVSMIQLAVPSRSEIKQYKELRKEIERLVGHINGLFAKPGWTPITYMCRSLPGEELFALYHAADIGLVTPLRDGMNLVAKEYVAAHNQKAGTLILSKLTGSATELKEALLVNPYDTNEIADAINEAICMPLQEKKSRMKKLNTTIQKQDVFAWVQRFINEAYNEQSKKSK